MILTQLRPLYIYMKKCSMTFCIFSFKKNANEFDVFYDIGIQPHRMGILAKFSDFNLWFNIQPGFNVNPRISKDQYKLLVSILHIKYDKDNHFSMTSFLEELNRKIPCNPLPVKEYEKTVLRVAISKYSMEEQDKIYYLGYIDWELPQNKGKGERSYKNLEKTRLLYPHIYEVIKNKNISIKYTSCKSGNIFSLNK